MFDALALLRPGARTKFFTQIAASAERMILDDIDAFESLIKMNKIGIGTSDGERNLSQLILDICDFIEDQNGCYRKQLVEQFAARLCCYGDIDTMLDSIIDTLQTRNLIEVTEMDGEQWVK